MNAIKNLIIGSVVALISAVILVIAFERNLSFLQIILGFGLYILPISFISIFTTKIPIFLLVFITAMITYFTIKFNFYDFWMGFFLALLIGGCIFYFRVYDCKPFSPDEYKKRIKQQIGA